MEGKRLITLSVNGADDARCKKCAGYQLVEFSFGDSASGCSGRDWACTFFPNEDKTYHLTHGVRHTACLAAEADVTKVRKIIAELVKLLPRVDRILKASSSMRDAANTLWLAQNPEEAAHVGKEPLPIEEAEEEHSAAFNELLRAECQLEKKSMLLRMLMG